LLACWGAGKERWKTVVPIAAGRAAIAKASRASPRIVGRLDVWFGTEIPCAIRGSTAQALDHVWLRAVLRACLVAQLRLQN
jgi:hypothetical protein